jgi:predicted HTH domain antitoxin
MALIISDKVLEKIDVTANKLLIDFACYLYERKQMSFGKCRELSGLNHLEFQKELGKREIYMHYDEDDLDTDLRNLRNES